MSGVPVVLPVPCVLSIGSVRPVAVTTVLRADLTSRMYIWHGICTAVLVALPGRYAVCNRTCVPVFRLPAYGVREACTSETCTPSLFSPVPDPPALSIPTVTFWHFPSPESRQTDRKSHLIRQLKSPKKYHRDTGLVQDSVRWSNDIRNTSAAYSIQRRLYTTSITWARIPARTARRIHVRQNGVSPVNATGLASVTTGPPVQIHRQSDEQS